jgi:hypothetical protein
LVCRYKSVDYLLDEPLQYYEAMTRNIAELAAWGKIGKLGGNIEEVFPPPQHPAAYFLGTEKRERTHARPHSGVGPSGSVAHLPGIVCAVAEEACALNRC